MDAWNSLRGNTGDAWARMSGTSGDAWTRLPGNIGDAWERLAATILQVGDFVNGAPWIKFKRVPPWGFRLFDKPFFRFIRRV